VAAATPEAVRAGAGAEQGAVSSLPGAVPTSTAPAAPPAAASSASGRPLPELTPAPPRAEHPAASPRSEPAPPRVHIGRLEVVVLSDAPAPPRPVESERRDALASRLYLRGL
jgi:hypothetical protein